MTQTQDPVAGTGTPNAPTAMAEGQEIVTRSTDVATTKLWHVSIDISQLPITMPDQTRRIHETIASLAHDKKAVIEWRGDAGRFTLNLVIAAEKSRDAWMLVDSTLTDVCIEETGQAPRVDNYTCSQR